jgi:PIN domain nuclease of toxin-antitoxin system
LIYVCDTHTFIWRQLGRTSQIGRKAARVLSRAERGLDEVRLPAIALFEIALLLDKRRLRARLAWDDWLLAAQAMPGLSIEPLSAGCVAEAGKIRGLADPIDRLIVATAIHLDVPLLTADAAMRAAKIVPVIWE